MNTLKFSITTLLFISLTACTKEDNLATTANEIISQASKTLVTGTWSVADYNEKGNNQTQYFSNYKFTFSSNNTVKATNGTNTINGSWQTGTDDSKPKFILNFSASNGPFEEISEDWKIIQITASKIELNHVSGGNAGTSSLTFVEN
jgi:hypothetical protein